MTTKDEPSQSITMSPLELPKEQQQEVSDHQVHHDGHEGGHVDIAAESAEVKVEDASPAPLREHGIDAPFDGHGHEHGQELTSHFEEDAAAAATASVENVVDASLSVLPGIFPPEREDNAAAAEGTLNGHHHEVTPESQTEHPHDDTDDTRGLQLQIHSLQHEPREEQHHARYHQQDGRHEGQGRHDDGHTNINDLDSHIHHDDSVEGADAPVAVHGEVPPQMEEDHEAAAAAIAAAEEAVGAVLDDVGVGRPTHDEHGELHQQQQYDLHVHGHDVGLEYAPMGGGDEHGQHDPHHGHVQLGHVQHLEHGHDDMVDPEDDGLYQQADDEVALAAAAAAAAVQAADGMSVMVDQALLATAAAAAASQVAAAVGADDLSHLEGSENPHHHQHSHHHPTHDVNHTHDDPYAHLQTHHPHHESHDHHPHRVVVPSLPEHTTVEPSAVDITSAPEISGENHSGSSPSAPPASGTQARATNQSRTAHTPSSEADAHHHGVPSGSVSTTSSTDDQKDSLLAARRLKDRRRYATMSPTQRAAYNAHRRELYHRQGEEARKRRRERERARYHSLEGDDKRTRNARRAQLERERYNKLSKEELAERNAKRRERAKMKKMMITNGGSAAATSGGAGATAAATSGASGENANGANTKERKKKVPRTDESQLDVAQDMNFQVKHEELTMDPMAESHAAHYSHHGEEGVPPLDEVVTVPEDIMADAVSAAAEVAERVVTAAAEAAAAAAAEASQHGDGGDDGNDMIVV